MSAISDFSQAFRSTNTAPLHYLIIRFERMTKKGRGKMSQLTDTHFDRTCDTNYGGKSLISPYYCQFGTFYYSDVYMIP